MKLNKQQRDALGINNQQLPGYIWNSQMGKIYQKIDKKNKELEDEGQTYLQFLQMEKREPNQQGTGRYKFQNINKIEYFFISKAHNRTIPKSAMNAIDEFLAAYLRIPTQHTHHIRLNVKGSSLIDKQKGVQYMIKHEEAGLDVYDLLDVLIEYRQEKTILVGIIEAGLQENGDTLDGRACGDGAAIIAFSKNDLSSNLEGLLQTILHETLHTLGFDHCVAWKCLMNAWTNFESWLCPACSRKLFHQLKIHNKTDAQVWMKAVTAVLEKLKCDKSTKKGREIMKSFSQA